MTSYELLFKTLSPGGFYVVEDVQTAFFPQFGGSLEMTMPNSVQFFSDIMAALVEGKPEAEDLRQMWRFHNIVAIQKNGVSDPALSEADRTLSAAHALEAGLSHALSKLQDGQSLQLAAMDSLPDTLRTCFAELDHREILVNYPEAQFSDSATQIKVMRAQWGAVTLEKGQNDYPSNFDFDAGHLEVRATFTSYKLELQKNPSERGLQLYGKWAIKMGSKDSLLFASDLLVDRQAREPLSLKIIIKAAAENDDATLLRRTLEIAYDLYPERDDFNTQMAHILMSDGDLEGAKQVLLEARRIGADSEKFCVQLGGLYMKLRQFDQALLEGKVATQVIPQKPVSWLLLIRAHMALNQITEAEEACQQAIGCCGKNELILIWLTKARLALKDVGRQGCDQCQISNDHS